MIQFLFQGLMLGVVLSGMGFTGVDEDELEPQIGVLLGHGLQRWRRQRAIGSSQRAELYDHVSLFPVVP